MNPEKNNIKQDKPPLDLTDNIHRFWSPSAALEEMGDPPRLEASPALKRLGPLPSARGGFPLMGFLATVYEQIATRATEGLREPNDQH